GRPGGSREKALAPPGLPGLRLAAKLLAAIGSDVRGDEEPVPGGDRIKDEEAALIRPPLLPYLVGRGLGLGTAFGLRGTARTLRGSPDTRRFALLRLGRCSLRTGRPGPGSGGWRRRRSRA